MKGTPNRIGSTSTENGCVWTGLVQKKALRSQRTAQSFPQ